MSVKILAICNTAVENLPSLSPNIKNNLFYGNYIDR